MGRAVNDGQLDRALGPPPKLDHLAGGWRLRLETWARQLYSVFERHPWALAESARRRLLGPNEFGWMKGALAALSQTGLVGAELPAAFVTVLGQVRNVAQHSMDALEQNARPWAQTIAELLRQHGERFPAARAAMNDGAFGPHAEDALAFGLACVLDGIERQAKARANRKRRRSDRTTNLPSKARRRPPRG